MSKENDPTIPFEIETSEYGEIKVGIQEGSSSQFAGQAYNRAMDAIAYIVHDLGKRKDELMSQVDSVEVKFGLKLDVQGSLPLLAKVGTASQIVVTVKIQR